MADLPQPPTDRPRVLNVHREHHSIAEVISPPMPRDRRPGAVYLGEEVTQG